MNKTIYNYDAATGLFTGAGEADANPEYGNALERAQQMQNAKIAGATIDEDLLKALLVEPEFHYPAHCVLIAPPDAPEGYAAFWRGASWEVALLPTEPGDAPHELSDDEKAAKRFNDAAALVQAHMDAMAYGMGYRGPDGTNRGALSNAITYAEEPAVPKFQTEGKALRSWRSRAWEWFYGEDVQAVVAADQFDFDSIDAMPKVYQDAVGQDDPAP